MPNWKTDWKIIKCGGHCYDGCGWFECSFWEHNETDCRCNLFGGIFGVLKNKSEALPQCNQIYGTNCDITIDMTPFDPHLIAWRSDNFRGEWVVTMSFNDRTIIAHDKDMHKAIEKSKKLGYPIMRKVDDPGPQGVMTYIPGEDEIMVGGFYYKRATE